jgi:hypothetical protein
MRDADKDAEREALIQKEKAPKKEGGVAPKGSEQPRPYPDKVDDTLDDSFPASDPPSS